MANPISEMARSAAESGHKSSGRKQPTFDNIRTGPRPANISPIKAGRKTSRRGGR